jgi:hypothetical protein
MTGVPSCIARPRLPRPEGRIEHNLSSRAAQLAMPAATSGHFPEALDLGDRGLITSRETAKHHSQT